MDRVANWAEDVHHIQHQINIVKAVAQQKAMKRKQSAKDENGLEWGIYTFPNAILGICNSCSHQLRQCQ